MRYPETMTDYSTLLQPDKGQPATAIHLITPTLFEDWLKAQPERVRSAVLAQGIKAKATLLRSCRATKLTNGAPLRLSLI